MHPVVILLGGYLIYKAFSSCNCPEPEKPPNPKRPSRPSRLIKQKVNMIENTITIKHGVFDGDGFESITGPYIEYRGNYHERAIPYLLLRHNGSDLRLYVDSEEEGFEEIALANEQIKTLKRKQSEESREQPRKEET